VRHPARACDRADRHGSRLVADPGAGARQPPLGPGAGAQVYAVAALVYEAARARSRELPDEWFLQTIRN
jgi:hypothetical protein